MVLRESKMERKLVVCEGPARGAEFVLQDGEEATIGRSVTADLRVEDPAVSRVHCKIVPQGGFWVVKDLESRNHVFVGKQTTEEHVLEDGDVFRLGKNTAIRFRIHDTTREAPPPPKKPQLSTKTVTDVNRPAMAPVAAAAASVVSLVGQTLGEFRVAEKIPSTGTAACYRALQPSLNRNVLLQVYPPVLSGNAAFRERLLAQVRAVSPLLHPGILQLFDLEEDAGRMFLVMEYFKGVSLSAHLAQKTFLPIRGAIDLAVKLSDALVYAEEQQCAVTEVDLENILIDENLTPKLRLFRDPSLDRGEPSQDADLACLAPEVLSPTPRADGRSAVYGLGALLYRCVGGMPPFRAPDRDALKAKILKDSPRDLKKLNIRASDVLCEIVSKAMQKSPQDRHQSPTELAQDLKRLMSGTGR
jgi:Protein kinase domain/FHA domain